jgi:hypothetical protein
MEKCLSWTTKGQEKIDLEFFKEHKALSKFLVMAKRERAKNEFRLCYERLDEEVPKELPSSVGELMKRFSAGTWQLTPDDVRVYLHHSIRQGKFKVVSGHYESSDHLISLKANITLV